MSKRTSERVCCIFHEAKEADEGQIADLVRPSLLESIQKHHPQCLASEFICFDDLGNARKQYVKEVLQDEIGELSSLDEEVVESLRQHEIVSSDLSREFDRKLTFGEALSDRIAEFGGSWKFIILFGGVLITWIIINGVILLTRAWDPYPFILLNL